MTQPPLDSLLRQLRSATRGPSDDLLPQILERLGPSVAQVRLSVFAGFACCTAAVLLSAMIASIALPRAESPALPPEFTVLTRGAGPLASL